MIKATESFFPPEDVKLLEDSASKWLVTISEQHPKFLGWAKGVVSNPDICSALFELVSWHKVSAPDLLSFLLEQRMGYLPARELRVQLRKRAQLWKNVERAAAKARKKTAPYLGELEQQGFEIEKMARRLSKYFIEPVAKRPLEEEIADSKQAVVFFLRRRNIRKVNHYGWVLLCAIFGKAWRAGTGKDQIEAFRAIPTPFTGRLIENSKEREKAIETAKLDVFMMKEKANR